MDQSPEVSKLFLRLAERLREEEKLTEELLALQGALQLLLAGACAGVTTVPAVTNTIPKLHPSENAHAHSNLIVNLT